MAGSQGNGVGEDGEEFESCVGTWEVFVFGEEYLLDGDEESCFRGKIFFESRGLTMDGA